MRGKLVAGGWCGHAPKLLYSEDMSMMVDSVMLMQQLVEECLYTDHLPIMDNIASQLAHSEDYVEAYDSLIQMIHRTRNANKEL